MDIRNEIKEILVNRFGFDIGGPEYNKSASAYLYIAPDRTPSDYFQASYRKLVEWEIRVTPEKSLVEIVAGVDTTGYEETVVKTFDIEDTSPSGLFNLCDEVDAFFYVLYTEFDDKYPDVYPHAY
jgi:phage baseplate assembly protein W